MSHIHRRLGDFWWYSLMLFVAQRAADFLNVFVGLYLVPKYVSPADLGAVMPLTTFASVLALPIAVFASTFRNEISVLAEGREFGRLKTLLRGTFVATAVFLGLALLVSRFVLPAYLERLRLERGTLGLLIVLTALVTSVAPIFSNALQALKKFKATAAIGIIGAPLRLLAMLLTMPLRPLSGYFVGQTAAPGFGILASVLALRRELSVPSAPYWDGATFRRVARFGFGITVATLVVSCWQLVSTTILRQRLPELDSAAYYMTSRFSEIANFLSATLIFTMFPYTAEQARRGESTTGLVVRASLAMVAFAAVLALFFAFAGRPVMAWLPHGDEYAAYAWAIPWSIGIAALCAIASFHVGTEISAQRFGFLKWYVPFNLGYSALMLFVTGHGYFTAWLPAAASGFLAEHTINSLPRMLGWLTAYEALRVAFAAGELAWRRYQTLPSRRLKSA